MKKIMVVVLFAGGLLLVGALVVVAVWGGVRALQGNVTALPNRGRVELAEAYRQAGSGALQEGRGRRQGSGAQGAEHLEAVADEWTKVDGVIVAGSEADTDLVLQTATGEQFTVGTGPGWLASQGFALREGDQVSVRGFWEDGEFKAGQITRQSDGASIVLRDANGRPAWAGQGRGRAGGLRAEARGAAPGNGR